MSKKLQNVKAVREMLDGTHKFQTKKTVGFSDVDATSKKNARHNIGDVWEEKDPTSGLIYIVEQRDGFRVRKTKSSDELQGIREELRLFANCPKDSCTCNTPNHLDEKMRKFHAMCFDCVIDMEHQMKKDGTYEEYEQNRVRANAMAWLREAEVDIKLLKEVYTNATQFVTNSTGDVETWSAKMTPEEFEETIQSGFDKYKENFLKNLNGENNENN
jgi:hypothetical protein